MTYTSFLNATGISPRIRAVVQKVARALRREGAPAAISGRGAVPSAASHEESRIAPRDAGWVQVMHVDGQTMRGRGRLMMWTERVMRDGEPIFEGRVESFTPADGAPEAGDHVLLLPEKANEHYPVKIRFVEGDRTILAVDWPGDELPAPLRELGGN